MDPRCFSLAKSPAAWRRAGAAVPEKGDWSAGNPRLVQSLTETRAGWVPAQWEHLLQRQEVSCVLLFNEAGTFLGVFAALRERRRGKVRMRQRWLTSQPEGRKPRVREQGVAAEKPPSSPLPCFQARAILSPLQPFPICNHSCPL